MKRSQTHTEKNKELSQVSFHVYNMVQEDYQVRNETINGREFYIVPVVMMVEGVHHGSAGPVLHVQENFSQNPSDWDNVPLTNGHPVVNGQYVFADQAPADDWRVGYVANTYVANGKLKAEAYIDIQRAIAINPEIINYIKEKKKLDVSTGASTLDTKSNGQWNGEEYQSITQSYNPDHLALLPGERGACSWDDGCGIRTNQKEEHDETMTHTTENDKEINVTNNLDKLQVNEAGFMTMVNEIQRMLDGRDNDRQSYFLEEVYDDNFVYYVRTAGERDKAYYRQDYDFNKEEEELSLNGGSQRVQKKVEYVTLPQGGQLNEETSNNSGCGCTMARTKFKVNSNQNQKEDNMSDSKNKQPSGEVMEKVVALTNNGSTRLSRSDREWLLTLNESQLDKLTPVDAEPEAPTREQAISVLSEDLSDTDKLLTIVADDIKEKIQSGIKTYENHRENLIKKIQANTGDIWTKEKLDGMDNETLSNLEKSTRSVDYSGQGSTLNNNSQGQENGEAPMVPAGVTLNGGK